MGTVSSLELFRKSFNPLYRSCDKANILFQVKSNRFLHFTMDANKGGNISDMAVDGTKVPDNAGKPNARSTRKAALAQASSRAQQTMHQTCREEQQMDPHMARSLRELAIRCQRRLRNQSTCQRARRVQRIKERVRETRGMT